MALPTAPAQDHAALIRSTTTAILAAAGTIAGTSVDQERIDPIEPGDMPRLIVFMDQSGETDSQAGPAVRFKMTGNLTIQALVQRARLADAVTDLDTLVAQTKYALLTSTPWVELTSNVPTLRVTSTFKSGGDYVTGDARLQITAIWFETYNPDVTTPLNRITAGITLSPSAPPINADLLN